MKMLQFTMAALIAITSVQKVSAQTFAAGKSGLYLTAADFVQNKISYEINCSGNDKLQVHALFGSSTVTVVQNGQKKAFPKKQLYGYRDCHNRNYRFFNGDAYLVTDTAGFFVYSATKTEAGPHGKGWVKSDKYYFSTGGDAPLQLLTIDNLKKAFPANHRFQYELEGVCKTDKDLVDYDVYTKSYRVKYLFSQSTK